MRYWYAIFCILLVSCATTETSTNDPIVVDTNDTAELEVAPEEIVVDAVIPTTSQNDTAQENSTVDVATNETIVPEESQLSRTEQYQDLIRTKVKYYAFDYEYEKAEDHSSAYFVVFRKDDWQVIEGGYWEINQTTRAVNELTTRRTTQIEDEIRREERDGADKINYTHHLVNYFWTNLTTSTMNACWVETSSNAWNSKDCESYSDEGVRRVYEDVDFTFRLYLPEYWLMKFAGKEPQKVDEGMTYKDNRNQQTTVDRVVFSTGKDTDTVLFVHQGYGIPLEVQHRTAGQIDERIVYDYMTINYPNTARWREGFLEP